MPSVSSSGYLRTSGGVIAGELEVRLSPDPGSSAGTALTVAGSTDHPSSNIIEAYDSNGRLGFAAQQVGGNDTGVYIESRDSGTPVLYINRRHAAQGQDILSIVDRFAEQGGFNKDGYFYTKRVAAPADDDVAASTLMVWFDDTAGLANLKIKARDAGNTIRTATIPLT